MAFVPIPKDLTNVKTKLMFNLTARQIICFSLAGAIGIPVFMSTRGYIGNEFAVFLVMAIASPFVFFAMFERDGLTGEKYLKQIIDVKYKRPAIRKYRNSNFYQTLQNIVQLEETFEEQAEQVIEQKEKKKAKSKFKKSKRKAG